MIAVFVFAALTFLSKPAAAYIGPGIAIALLGYVSWPIAVLIGILSIFFYYPLRWVYRKFFPKKDTPEKTEPQDTPPS